MESVVSRSPRMKESWLTEVSGRVPAAPGGR